MKKNRVFPVRYNLGKSTIEFKGQYPVVETSVRYIINTDLLEGDGFKSYSVNQSKLVADLIYEFVDQMNYCVAYKEHAFAVYMNRSNAVVALQLISIGGITGTVMDIREIAVNALNLGASSVILSHNHPSDKFYPSESDLSITSKFKEGLKLLEIELLDHIIIGSGKEEMYYSFADNGTL